MWVGAEAHGSYVKGRKQNIRPRSGALPSPEGTVQQSPGCRPRSGRNPGVGMKRMLALKGRRSLRRPCRA